MWRADVTFLASAQVRVVFRSISLHHLPVSAAFYRNQYRVLCSLNRQRRKIVEFPKCGNIPPMKPLAENEVYGVIGDDGFQRLVAAFYRQVPGDDILGPMYPAEDLVGAEQRLRSFLIYRFGGPQTYAEQRGHPRLRMRHMPFVIDQQARDRWLTLMQNALEEAELPTPASTTLGHFFDHMATFLINRMTSSPGFGPLR